MYQSSCVQEPRKIQFQRLPILRPHSHEVTVRVEGCGLCGSNLPVWQGQPWFQYPLQPGTPGHEGWGTVEEVGAEVEKIRTGDRVAFLGQRSFAEMDKVAADHVVGLPPELMDCPFPGEALGCAMNVFRRCDIQPGQTVAVVGVGFLGALLVQLATHAGAEVIALSRRKQGRAAAARSGARETLPMDSVYEAVGNVRELTGGHGCSRVIECTGFQEPLDLSGEITAERGKLVIAGYHQDGPRQVNLQQWNWKGLDVINAHERDPAIYMQGMREAVEAVRTGMLDPRPLYTHHFPLSRIDAAFDAMEQRHDGFLKALIIP